MRRRDVVDGVPALTFRGAAVGTTSSERGA